MGKQKQRVYMVIEDQPFLDKKQVICKKHIGPRTGMPWRELTEFSGYRLISFSPKGDYRDRRDHGVIETKVEY